MPKTPAGATRKKVHQFVVSQVLRGEPPSVREVQEYFGFKSSATAREHLNALVTAGLLDHQSGKDRGYRVPGAAVSAMVPRLGRVRAGGLSEALEFADGYVAVEQHRAESTFALTVVGESMAGREIHDGDVLLVERNVAVRSGDVVVALIGDEATVKTFSRNEGQIVLKAENPDFPDIIPDPQSDELSILGRVYEVRRML